MRRTNQLWLVRFWGNRRQPTAGFSLLEMLVVLLIIGVLFGIIAASWNVFLNRERVSTVREQVVQAVREAQNQARTQRTPKALVFDTVNGVPQFAIFSVQNGTNPAAVTVPTGTWKRLGQDLRPGAVEMTVTGNVTGAKSLILDGNGAVATSPVVPSSATQVTDTRPFVVAVKARGSGNPAQRCVVVPSLLGSPVRQQGSACS